MALFTDAIDRLRGRSTSYDWRYAMPTIRDGSIDLADGLSASYAAIYRSQPWVYAAVNKLSKSVARMPLKAFERNAQTRNRLYDGDLYRLTTNPYAGMTPFMYKERAVKNTAIYGNAFFVKMGVKSPDDIPTELLPAPSVGWSLGERRDQLVWMSRSGDPYPFERFQLIHYRFWDLDECGFGMSMLEPLRRTLAIEDAAQRYGVAAFKNGAKPGSVLTTPNSLKKEGIEAARAELMAIHGGVDNAFKAMILQQGLTFATIEHDLNKAAVIEHRKLARDEVSAVFDVPGATIGNNDEANFASVDAFHTFLYQDSLGAWVSMIEETTQADLIDPVPAFANQFVEFDMNAVMRGSFTERTTGYQRAGSVYLTTNEIRELENRPPLDDDDANRVHYPAGSSPDPAIAAGKQNTPGTNTRTLSANGANHV